MSDEKTDAADETVEEREERKEDLIDSAKKNADGLTKDLKELEDVSTAGDDMEDREKFDKLGDKAEEIRKELD